MKAKTRELVFVTLRKLVSRRRRLWAKFTRNNADITVALRRTIDDVETALMDVIKEVNTVVKYDIRDAVKYLQTARSCLNCCWVSNSFDYLKRAEKLLRRACKAL